MSILTYTFSIIVADAPIDFATKCYNGLDSLMCYIEPPFVYLRH